MKISLVRVFSLVVSIGTLFAVAPMALANSSSTQLAELVFTEGHGIGSVQADGSGYRTLNAFGWPPRENSDGSYNGNFGPEISPNGKRMVFSQLNFAAKKRDRLMVSDRNGRNPLPIFAVKSFERNKDRWINMPTWSADGRRILFVLQVNTYVKGYPRKSTSKVLSIKPDGSGLKSLFTRFIDQTKGQARRGIGSIDSVDPSPDGHSLLLSGYSHVRRESAIWSLDLRSGRTRFLHRGELPDWSPDGKSIVFDSTFEELGSGSSGASGGNAYDSRIYVMNADGSEVRRLVQDQSEGEELYPSWSPDGQRIAFTSDRATHWDGFRSISEIYTVRTDGSCLFQVTDAGRETTKPTWGPERDFSSEPGECN